MFKAEKQQENSIKLQAKIFVEQNFPKAQQPNGMSTLWARANYLTKRHFKRKNHVFQHILQYKFWNFFLEL